jgi:hypothetical protein
MTLSSTRACDIVDKNQPNSRAQATLSTGDSRLRWAINQTCLARPQDASASPQFHAYIRRARIELRFSSTAQPTEAAPVSGGFARLAPGVRLCCVSAWKKPFGRRLAGSAPRFSVSTHRPAPASPLPRPHPCKR